MSRATGSSALTPKVTFVTRLVVNLVPSGDKSAARWMVRSVMNPRGCPGSRVFSRPGNPSQRHRATVPSVTARHKHSFYARYMPRGLERWHGGRNLHFITFSCYCRRPLLESELRRDLFLKVLEEVRRRYRWVVLGYVVMPEHVHLLVSEPQQRPLANAMQALKLGFARRVLAARSRHRDRDGQAELFEAAPQHIWQARYHDFNVCSARKRIEKLRYLHRNPVKRGLVDAPELWRWSSFRVTPIRKQESYE
jgi:putative transposase